jgi:hypothetical protein
METKDRQKILLITAASGLALLIANSAIFGPLQSGWTSRSKEIATLKQNVADGRNLLLRKDRLQSRWQSMQTNTLPNDQTSAGSALLKAVYRWGQDSGTSIDQVTPQWKSEQDADNKNVITTMECHADATGNMRSILRFLWDLESDPVGLKVEDVVISSRDNDGQQLSLGIQMSGLVLGPPQPQQQAKVP